MSDPIDTTKVGKYQAIQNALCELVSAESSCNMHPDPIPLDPALRDDEVDCRYISESDANVKHALEHMHAAFRLMNMAHHDQEVILAEGIEGQPQTESVRQCDLVFHRFIGVQFAVDHFPVLVVALPLGHQVSTVGSRIQQHVVRRLFQRAVEHTFEHPVVALARLE